MNLTHALAALLIWVSIVATVAAFFDTHRAFSLGGRAARPAAVEAIALFVIAGCSAFQAGALL